MVENSFYSELYKIISSNRSIDISYVGKNFKIQKKPVEDNPEKWNWILSISKFGEFNLDDPESIPNIYAQTLDFILKLASESKGKAEIPKSRIEHLLLQKCQKELKDIQSETKIKLLKIRELKIKIKNLSGFPDAYLPEIGDFLRNKETNEVVCIKRFSLNNRYLCKRLTETETPYCELSLEEIYTDWKKLPEKVRYPMKSGESVNRFIQILDIHNTDTYIDVETNYPEKINSLMSGKPIETSSSEKLSIVRSMKISDYFKCLEEVEPKK